jgi:hypothetical protein
VFCGSKLSQVSLRTTVVYAPLRCYFDQKSFGIRNINKLLFFVFLQNRFHHHALSAVQAAYKFCLLFLNERRAVTLYFKRHMFSSNTIVASFGMPNTDLFAVPSNTFQG